MKTTPCAAKFLLTSLPFVNLLNIIEDEVHHAIQPATITKNSVVAIGETKLISLTHSRNLLGYPMEVPSRLRRYP
jgi:hypothetical protein